MGAGGGVNSFVRIQLTPTIRSRGRACRSARTVPGAPPPSRRKLHSQTSLSGLRRFWDVLGKDRQRRKVSRRLGDAHETWLPARPISVTPGNSARVSLGGPEVPPDSCRPSSGPGQPLVHPRLRGFSCSGASRDTNHGTRVLCDRASPAALCPWGRARGGGPGLTPPPPGECRAVFHCGCAGRPGAPLRESCCWGRSPDSFEGTHVFVSSGQTPRSADAGRVMTGFGRSWDCQTAVRSGYPVIAPSLARSPTPLITAL